MTKKTKDGPETLTEVSVHSKKIWKCIADITGLGGRVTSTTIATVIGVSRTRAHDLLFREIAAGNISKNNGHGYSISINARKYLMGVS